MIKAGIYKQPSFNQTVFCFEIIPPDYIKVWREDIEGNNVDNGWWDAEITPEKFKWLVGEWNNGNIKKVYTHWWEQVDNRKEKIKTLLQLSESELLEVFNYYCYVLPHYRWATDLHLNDNLRPLFHRGSIVKFDYMSEEEATRFNIKEKLEKRYISDRYMWGSTDSEIIQEHIEDSISE